MSGIAVHGRPHARAQQAVLFAVRGRFFTRFERAAAQGVSTPKKPRVCSPRAGQGRMGEGLRTLWRRSISCTAPPQHSPRARARTSRAACGPKGPAATTPRCARSRGPEGQRLMCQCIYVCVQQRRVAPAPARLLRPGIAPRCCQIRHACVFVCAGAAAPPWPPHCRFSLCARNRGAHKGAA